jgi:hypothetical protein
MTFAPLSPLLFAAAFVAAAPLTETQFSASATETHFAATNPNDCTVLLILGDALHGARAQMLVAPFQSFETNFPSGTLDDLYMEVVFFTPTGPRSTGSVNFDALLAPQAELYEVAADGGELQPWICSGGVRMPVEPGILLAPPAWLEANAGSSQPIVIEPTHVPVLTPTDTDTDNWAPKIHSTNPII